LNEETGVLDKDVHGEQEFVEKLDEFEGYGLVVKKLCKVRMFLKRRLTHSF
jgi:hypothetical protein